MAPANLDFEEFLRQLAAQRGTTRKLRLAARYWRQIKSLSAAERERVALTLGSRVAWKQLERLFLRDGTLSEDERAVQEALDRLGDADPAELRRWAAQLRQADRRRVSDLVATAVQAALEQEAEELGDPTPAPVASQAEPRDTDQAPAIATPPGPEPVAPAATRPVGPDPGPSAARPGPRSRPPAAADTSAEESRPAPTLPVAPARPQSIRSPIAQAPVSAAPGPEPVARAVTGPISSEPARVADLAAPFPEDFHREGPRGALTAAQRLRELRELRQNPAGVAALGVSGRAELVAKLGPGWASRRAVSELIRGGAVTGVDESLRLIAQLDTPTRRSWCLGVLIDHMKLSGAERERVLDAAPTAAARRRLARRLDSSRTR